MKTFLKILLAILAFGLLLQLLPLVAIVIGVVLALSIAFGVHKQSGNSH
ncbi:MAG: hypothetical protein ACPGSD_15800 [Flavobacteriales bacterium]